MPDPTTTDDLPEWVATARDDLIKVATKIGRLEAEAEKLRPRRNALIATLGKAGWSQTQIAKIAGISKQAVGFVLQPPKRQQQMSRDRTVRARRERADARARASA